MERIIIDTRGMTCPQPVIETKNALQKSPSGGTVSILAGTRESSSNIENYLRANGLDPQTTSRDNFWEISVSKISDTALQSAPETCCVSENATGPHVICVAGNRMGHGPGELGRILIRAFINSIHEVTPLPRTIVFYNSGIELALKDSPVLGALRELEAAGVKILVCGTCTKFFNQTENVAVGKVSNMFEILETLSKATHVVTP
jgi:selenium metabolism protein YedF